MRRNRPKSVVDIMQYALQCTIAAAAELACTNKHKQVVNLTFPIHTVGEREHQRGIKHCTRWRRSAYYTNTNYENIINVNDEHQRATRPLHSVIGQ